MSNFREWMNTITYVTKGITEGTTEEAMLHFFYDGVSPWIQSFGYSWSDAEHIIAKKFVRFCYDINVTSKMDSKYSLVPPDAPHRDLFEDRETFDFLVDTADLVELLSEWEFRDEVVGTRLDYLILDFCYTWVSVVTGYPGTRTERILQANDDDVIDDDVNNLPDGNWNRRKYDLY